MKVAADLPKSTVTIIRFHMVARTLFVQQTSVLYFLVLYQKQQPWFVNLIVQYVATYFIQILATDYY